MKKIIIAMASLSVLTGCSNGYDLENPSNKGDFIASMVNPVQLGLSEKQNSEYWSCMSPHVSDIEAKLSQEESAKIDEILTVMKEDPEANRPDLQGAVIVLSARIAEHGSSYMKECLSKAGYNIAG